MKLHERKITSFPFVPTEHNSKNSGCQARFGRGRPAFSGTPSAGINSREILDADRGKEGCDAVRHDWKLIEADFLATGQSYRALAQKYGAGLSSVKKHAAAGRWQEKLLELSRGERAAALAEPVDLALEKRLDRRALLLDTADEMLEKLRRAAAQLEPGNTLALASLVRALKDLKELQGLQKDALDLEEQQTRIEKMRSEIRKAESGEGPAGVLILPAIEEDRE